MHYLKQVSFICMCSAYHDGGHRSVQTAEEDELHRRKHRSSSKTRKSGSRSPHHRRRRSRSVNKLLRPDVSHVHTSSHSRRSDSKARARSRSRSESRSRGARTNSSNDDYKKLDRKTMVYATSLAAELRKRRLQLNLKTTSDARPRPKNVGGGSADEPVIIIDDDLTSSEDEVTLSDNRSAKYSCTGDGKRPSLEPDAKKQKTELTVVGASDERTLPAPIVDHALLSAIPMPSQCLPVSAIPVPSLLPPASAVIVEQKFSPAVAEEKSLPVPNISPEQHSTPAAEDKTSPASANQSVTNTDTPYAFRRLTELPMPPSATDDECESPSESSR